MDKYGALVFVLTFLVDLLLLWGAAGEDRSILCRIRCAVGAAIGAGYALFALHSLKRDMLLLVLLLMGLIAFGIRNAVSWGRFLFLWLVANAMAVGVTDADGWFLTLAAALLCLLMLLGPEGGAAKERVEITLQYGGRTARLRGLRDNGNLLRDPLTGEAVLIVSPWVGSDLLGLTQRELMHPIKTMEDCKVPGLRLIPYSCVGQPAGMLLAMRFREVSVDGKKGSRIVAFSPNPIGEGQGFEALAGGMA